MKDIARHKKNVQRKILREARQEEEGGESEASLEGAEGAQTEAVEVEETPLLRRPLNRKYH